MKLAKKAFEDIKEYLTKPSPGSSRFGKIILTICGAMDHPLGTLLVEKNDKGFEQAIYYLSITLIGAESLYNPVEKECLALVFAV